MASAITPLMLFSTCATSHLQPLSSPSPLPFLPPTSLASAACKTHRNILPVPKSSPENDGIVAADNEGEDGVSLGTFKLPGNTDLQRFETLLFQWANSLCQGANLPLPMPLKVDKISGGARLGFITIEDGKTEVLVYIDCLVFPATSDSGPIFRAVRNGPLKDAPPPGEPRIMRSLLQALQKSVQIATNSPRFSLFALQCTSWCIDDKVAGNRGTWILHEQKDSLAAVACGPGGGSLVNAGVMLPTPIRARRNPKWQRNGKGTGIFVSLLLQQC
uniref:DUF7148 domain-containing protein n=1 Tax=Salix viminalis TaxID=40686 RepID=A0A6N2MQ01_SALVM